MGDRREETQLWRDGDVEPAAPVEEAGGRLDPRAVVWDLPDDCQGVVVLGTPVGHPQFMSRVIESKKEE